MTKEEAAKEWARCKHWIEAALEHDFGTHTIEDVEDGIAQGRFQFWPGEKCALVTELNHYPRRSLLNFYLVGGDLDELINHMEPVVCAWAKTQGCDGARQTGRPGWKKYLEPKGYKEILRVMVKEI